MKVVNDLLELAADDERSHALRPGDVIFVHNGDADLGRSTAVDIPNMRILLRPCDTISHQAAVAAAFAAVTFLSSRPGSLGARRRARRGSWPARY
ncbi:hypothetical protein [Nocardia sp. NRRL S-836]|uniref:hypothetical protein n=1 Tax=Nocardia sp. NRRL S-836 TaxID=1519492 RepID=UPI0006AFDDD3|nr:hypothetical protein [Nocardia sp. NRRL S-836]KOV77637.1 hypothetical protein ADL03_41575 [Nocardia sp. NRRL S-836]